MVCIRLTGRGSLVSTKGRNRKGGSGDIFLLFPKIWAGRAYSSQLRCGTRSQEKCRWMDFRECSFSVLNILPTNFCTLQMDVEDLHILLSLPVTCTFSSYLSKLNFCTINTNNCKLRIILQWISWHTYFVAVCPTMQCCPEICSLNICFKLM